MCGCGEEVRREGLSTKIDAVGFLFPFLFIFFFFSFFLSFGLFAGFDHVTFVALMIVS